jgi:hypothetical protein
VLPVTQPSRRRLSRHERILGLAKNLTDVIDVVTLEEIDGEYYWRICRDDLFEPLIDLAASFTPHGAEGPLPYDQAFLALGSDHEKVVAFLNTARPLIDEIPRHVWIHLGKPKPLPLRPSSFGVSNEATAFQARVHSRAWTGADLEAELAWRREEDPSWFAPDASDMVSLRIDFALVREPPPVSLLSEFGPYPVPFIEITLPFPLPSQGIVGREYDAIVRDQRQWHLELPGGETKQEKEVALRTWTVGLLMAEGKTFTDAQREVESRTGHSGVSQARFIQDRRRLIERVPEAEPYLYVRVPRT